MENSNLTRSWDMQPDETDKAFAAFVLYRNMPPYGENSRSIQRVISQLGLSNGAHVGAWSSKYGWVERAKAYDAYMATRAVAIQEVAQTEYAEAVVTQTTARLAYLGRILEKVMRKVDEDIDADKTVDIGDIKRIVDMIKTVDDLSRRAAGLPTTYITKPSEVKPETDQVFIIGGENANDTDEDLEYAS